MKVGNLVNFYSTVASFQKDYNRRNPGLIIAAQPSSPTATKHSWDRASAYVLWSNGDMTKEHQSYLVDISNQEDSN